MPSNESENPCLGKCISYLDVFLKTGDQLQIEKPRSKPLRHGIYNIVEIFYEEVRNGVFAIDYIKNFQGGPDIFQFAERTMTSPIGLVIIQQKRAETNVG